MQRPNENLLQTNVAIDVTKLVMAYLVIAIHTEPFGFSFWLDKGFGIFTRFCVPFFFVASSYFFFSKEDNNPIKYLKRIFTLYFIWSIIYLPWDIAELKAMSIIEILTKYFWAGNGHALWYLCGSMVGFIIVYSLSRILKPNKVLIVAVTLLIIGCMKSTYAPMLEELLSISFVDYLGSRNGLFYASTYYALGLWIAKTKPENTDVEVRHVVGFLISFIALAVESVVLVLVFNAQATILWLSVLPLTYNFFMIVKNLHIAIEPKKAYFLRKLSTGIYVSHCVFMYLLDDMKYWILFISVSIVATGFSMVLITLSKKKSLNWLKFLI